MLPFPSFLAQYNDLQQAIAYVAGGAFCAYGAFMLLLWGMVYTAGTTEKSRIMFGTLVVILGILIIVFGMYLAIPLAAVFLFWIGSTVGRTFIIGIKLLFTKDKDN